MEKITNQRGIFDFLGGVNTAASGNN